MEGLETQGVSVQERLDALDNAQLLYWPRAQKGFPRLKHFADRLQGASLPDIWTDIAPINSQAAERLGYPTQKPEALLERIIKASSNEGDAVLDPFCGCGTAIAAAHRLKRCWIGIDVTHLAITLIMGGSMSLHWEKDL
jgi:site-specific DNA-methyltransferase (adenine-specific)